MFSWLKKLLGIGYTPKEPKQEPLVLAQEVRVEEPKKTTTPKPKTAKVEEKAPKAKAPAKPKKVEKSDDGLDSMNKRDLLALAKDKGVKANASMNKADIVKAIRNA